MVYVTDTHPFLWYLAEDKRLSKAAKVVFDSVEAGNATIIVPTIVLAESLHILEKGRFSVKFMDIVRKIDEGWNYSAIPLDVRVIKRIEELTKLSELHDRIIVASADILGAELITKDAAIKQSGYVRTVW
ncbi:MAG: PIN domain-containing protein [Candidatus Aenigmarchaeota archaeon]|nr:PIN domain-containing protein [Candidatus Aenigmarchaeota archaeon]